jgi:hypothetical protein
MKKVLIIVGDCNLVSAINFRVNDHYFGELLEGQV